MFKLLTDESRSKATKEYALRRISVILALVSILLLFIMFALAPSLIISTSRVGAARTILASAERSGRTTEKESLEAWAAGIRSRLAHLAPGESEEGPYEYFQKVILERPDGISITGLSVGSTDSSANLRVRGVAKDRQTLLLFESGLRNSGEWESTNFPVGNLAKDADISFELTLVPR